MRSPAALCAVFFALALAPRALAKSPTALPMMVTPRITPKPVISKALAVRGGILHSLHEPLSHLFNNIAKFHTCCDMCCRACNCVLV